MSDLVERFLFEAVANTSEPDDDGCVQVDWLIEGGADALEGPTLLMALTDGHIGEDFEGGEYFVLASDYDAALLQVAALREDRDSFQRVGIATMEKLHACERLLTAAEQRNAEWRELLRVMTNEYACCLEAGYDRITSLQGDCDSVSRMLADNPNYAKAVAALAKPTESGASE